MNFDLTEEQRRIRETLTDFAEREIKPHSTKRDKEETFPRHIVEQLGQLGFLGVAFPEKFGGGGADTLSQVLVATGLGDNYSITGSKMFITNGTVADVYVVMAITDNSRGRDGVSAFIVDRGTAGLSNGKKIEKLGLRASDTAEVIFENVIVPSHNLVGELGAGYRQTLKVLEAGRIGVAGFAAGIARGGIEEARAYALGGGQFGKKMAEF